MAEIAAASPLKDEAGNQSFARLVRTGLELRENPGRYKLMVVTDGSTAVSKSVATALGAPLPEHANDLTGDDPCCYWLAPNRWLVCYERGYGLGERLIRTSAGIAAAVNDVSDGHVSIELTGRLAHELLVRGCEQDLHRRVFGPGRFAVTQIAAIDVLIHARSEADSYELIVDRSLAVDLWIWLKDKAAELNA